MNRNYTIICMHEAVSPISHMEGTHGNVAVLMRHAVLYEGEQHRVPCLTGNALRHCMLREPSAHILKTRLGLYGHLSPHQDRFLTSGQERSVKGNAVDVGLMRRGFEIHPHVRVLGGTLPTEVVRGRASVGFGVLMCRESQRDRKALVPQWGVEDRPLMSYQAMIEMRQYTRKSEDLDTREGEQRDNAMMIFGGYTIIAGSVFIQRIDLNNCRDIDAGMACAAIEMWDGTIGGQKSRGHGRLNSTYAVLRDGAQVEAQPLVDAYEDHIEKNKQAMIDWIFEAVGEKTPEALTCEPAA